MPLLPRYTGAPRPGARTSENEPRVPVRSRCWGPKDFIEALAALGKPGLGPPPGISRHSKESWDPPGTGGDNFYIRGLHSRINKNEGSGLRMADSPFPARKGRPPAITVAFPGFPLALESTIQGAGVPLNEGLTLAGTRYQGSCPPDHSIQHKVLPPFPGCPSVPRHFTSYKLRDGRKASLEGGWDCFPFGLWTVFCGFLRSFAVICDFLESGSQSR